MVVHFGLAYMDNAHVTYKKVVGNMIDNYFDYLQMAEQNQNHQMIVLEQGCFTSHLLSFDNNKVLKIINWIC